MMSREMMREVLEGLGADVSYSEDVDGFDVSIEDFVGFDEDYSEVFRDLDDSEAVERFVEMLLSESLSQEGDYYIVYHFADFELCLGYASFDI